MTIIDCKKMKEHQWENNSNNCFSVLCTNTWYKLVLKITYLAWWVIHFVKILFSRAVECVSLHFSHPPLMGLLAARIECYSVLATVLSTSHTWPVSFIIIVIVTPYFQSLLSSVSKESIDLRWQNFQGHGVVSDRMKIQTQVWHWSLSCVPSY